MHNADNEISRTLIDTLISTLNEEGGKGFIVDPSVLPYTKRIMLCAASDSPFLTRLTQDLLKEIWFNSFRIKEKLLSLEEKIEVNFIFAGLVATLGSREAQEFPNVISMLAESEIGQAMVSTLKIIASHQENC